MSDIAVDPVATRGGYIYVVEDGQYCKIGMSASHPSKRVQHLQIGNKNPLRLAFYAPINPGDDLASREKEIHGILDPYFVRGEWFSVSPLAAAHAICDMLGIEKPASIGKVRSKRKASAVPRLTVDTASKVKATLTNTAIDALQPGERLKDDRVPGLEVRGHAGGKSFLLYYRTRTGIARRPKIGNYPVLSLAAARDIARDMLGRVAAGDDPSRDRQSQRDAPDVDALWLRCETEHYSQEKKWGRDAKSIYTRHLKKPLGRLKVNEVGVSDIKAIHEALGAPPSDANHKRRATPNEANRMLAVVSKMLSLAETWEYRPVGSNPCQAIARYPEKKRRRFASPEEIKRIGACLDKYAADPEHTSGVAFLALLMFSGARPSEIANGTPDMIERRGDAGVLRLEHGKTGRRDVYLPPQAMRVLDKLPPDRKTLSGRSTVPRALWEIIVKEADCPGLWARDLRRTFATVALSGGVPLGVVGELLGHASAQTTKIYALLLEDQAHAAAAGVASRMEQLIGGGNAVVDPGGNPFD